MTSPSSPVTTIEHGILPGIGDFLQRYGGSGEAAKLHPEGEGQHIADILFRELHELEPAEDEGMQKQIESFEGSDSGIVPDMASAAREEAIELARREFDAALDARLADEQRKVERMRAEFARDRQRFFAAAEAQLVRLALAVASRVLAREVAADSLHLRATVKAALARVQDASVTTLRVPVDEIEGWSETFQQGTTGKLVVEGDDRLRKGDCVLETSVGRVELGVDVQMSEIERGFGELLQGQKSDSVDGIGSTNEVGVEREGLQ